MSKRSVLEDLATIAFPGPDPDLYTDEDPDIRNDALEQLEYEAQQQRQGLITELSERWDEAHLAAGDDAVSAWDPLLYEVTRAADEIAEARHRMRLLFAFAREVVRPRPYRLEDLAAAAGMSYSGVRTAYGPDEVTEVHRILGLGEPFQYSGRERVESDEDGVDPAVERARS